MKQITIFLICLLFTACGSSGGLQTTNVAYVSVKTRHMQPTTSSPIPDNAKIAVAYSISQNGEFTAIVYNRTSEIMTIDQNLSLWDQMENLFLIMTRQCEPHLLQICLQQLKGEV